LLYMQPFAVEPCITPDTTQTDYWAIVDKQQAVDAAIGYAGWSLGVAASGGRGVYFALSSAAQPAFLQSLVLPPAGVFTHVVGLFDGVDERIYVDGVRKSSF